MADNKILIGAMFDLCRSVHESTLKIFMEKVSPTVDNKSFWAGVIVVSACVGGSVYL
jgi:hypothetical protein